MGDVIKGKFVEEVDTTKHYICYYCEEEVEFSVLATRYLDPDSIGTDDDKPRWRHSDGGRVACSCDATPSNLELPAG